MKVFFPILAGTVCSLVPVEPAAQGCNIVQSHQKISETQGGFTGLLDVGDDFGTSVAAIGDLDGDGVGDLAVGAPADDDGSSDRGAVWILFLDTDGTVKSQQKISATAGGFTGVLGQGNEFGYSVASLGDLDGDGIQDLAVGAPFENQSNPFFPFVGAVWVLFLNTDGTVKSHHKINETLGGFTGALDADQFGSALASLGDLDGDGIGDLAVGAEADSDNSTRHGAVWILFLQNDGTVKAQQKINQGSGGFAGVLDAHDHFGCAVSPLGDLDGDGIGDLAVGAFGDNEGQGLGAIWVLFLNADVTVKSHQKISQTQGGFGGILGSGGSFGWSLATLDDLDGDGSAELACGSIGGGSSGQGAFWVLSLDTDGTVKSERGISEAVGGFTGALDPTDAFGSSLAWLGDIDADGVGDLAVGAWGDDDGGVNQGAVWILFLDEDATPPILTCPPVVSVKDRKLNGPGEVVFFSVTASDDCDPAPVVVCLPPSGSLFPAGTTTVICTATDAAGNQSVGMFPVVVLPTVSPKLR